MLPNQKNGAFEETPEIPDFSDKSAGGVRFNRHLGYKDYPLTDPYRKKVERRRKQSKAARGARRINR